jgi:hypothetical protein
MAVTPVIRGTQAQVSWQSAKLKVGNQPDSKLAISRIKTCDKNSIVAVKPELNKNFWRLSP